MLFYDGRGWVSNPHSTYFKIDEATGVLSYKSPGADFMNGLA